MIKEAFFLGCPQNFKGKFDVYPPTVKDICSNTNALMYYKVLTTSAEEIEDQITEMQQQGKVGEVKEFPSPIEFMLGTCYSNKQYETIAKQAFQFFIKQEVSFLYDTKQVLIGNIEEVLKEAKTQEDFILLNEEEFFEFQNCIRNSMGDKPIDPPNPNENPRIKKMKAKARYRDRIKAKQGKGISLYTSLVSICCMGIGITPLNIGEMSYAAVNGLMPQYQEKEKYDIDIKSLLAGADSKKIKPKYWIRNLDEK